MGCFDLTKGLCDKISAMVARFWWSQQDNDQKMHWLSWEKLTRAKGDGGLGFRDIHGFNLAMLAKQGWRLLMNPNSLCAQVLQAKYFADGKVLNAKPKHNMSYTWRSILAGIAVLKKGLIRRIGDGMDTCIWTDEWIPRDSSRKPYTPRGGSLLTRVHELIDPATGWWDEELVRATLWHEDAKVILSIPVHEGMDDMLAWHYNKNRIFSVKSAYKVYIVDRDQNRTNGQSGSSSASLAGGDQIWKRLWKVDCPKKMLHFMWRLCHNSLALRVNLKRRGIKLENLCCVLCGRFDEDGAHLFFSNVSV
jgi:hypothetical protein